MQKWLISHFLCENCIYYFRWAAVLIVVTKLFLGEIISIKYGMLVSAKTYAALCKEQLIYPQKEPYPLLKRLRRKKNYPRLNVNIKLISSEITSALLYWYQLHVDGLNKSFIYGPTDTPVHLHPHLFNPFVFKPATNSDILPLLYRIKSNSAESSLGIPPYVGAKELCAFVTDSIKCSFTHSYLPSSCSHWHCLQKIWRITTACAINVDSYYSPINFRRHLG